METREPCCESVSSRCLRAGGGKALPATVLPTEGAQRSVPTSRPAGPGPSTVATCNLECGKRGGGLIGTEPRGCSGSRRLPWSEVSGGWGTVPLLSLSRGEPEPEVSGAGEAIVTGDDASSVEAGPSCAKPTTGRERQWWCP